MTKQLKPISEMSDEEIIAHYGVAGMKWGQKKSYAPTSTSRARPSRKELDYDFLLPGNRPAADPKVAAVNAIKRIEAISEEEEEEEEASDEKEPKKAAAASSTAAASKLNSKIQKAQKEVDGLTAQRDEEQTALRSQMARESFKAEILRQVSKYFVTGKDGSQNSDYARTLQESSSKRIKEHEAKAKLIETEAKKRQEAWDSSIGEAQEKVTQMEDKRDKMSHGEGWDPTSKGLKPISEMSYDEAMRHFGGYKWNARRAFLKSPIGERTWKTV